jgi:hypothetical protein
VYERAVPVIALIRLVFIAGLIRNDTAGHAGFLAPSTPSHLRNNPRHFDVWGSAAKRIELLGVQEHRRTA